MTPLQKRLVDLQDPEYRKFNSALIPDVPDETVIGVRVPLLRKLAKEIRGTAQAEAFLHELPHTYYEENQLHSLLLNLEKDFNACVEQLKVFLPYVDNWAVCDSLRPAVLGKYPVETAKLIPVWLNNAHPYTVRFGEGVIMRWYLEEHFKPEYLDMAAALRRDEYYVRMMTAWLFATALAKQYETAVGYLENNKLDVWTHNKTIQKAVESYRISSEQKQYLRTLKRSGRQ